MPGRRLFYHHGQSLQVTKSVVTIEDDPSFFDDDAGVVHGATNTAQDTAAPGQGKQSSLRLKETTVYSSDPLVESDALWTLPSRHLQTGPSSMLPSLSPTGLDEEFGGTLVAVSSGGAFVRHHVSTGSEQA